MCARPTLVKLWWSYNHFLSSTPRSAIHTPAGAWSRLLTNFLWDGSQILIWDKSSLHTANWNNRFEWHLQLCCSTRCVCLGAVVRAEDSLSAVYYLSFRKSTKVFKKQYSICTTKPRRQNHSGRSKEAEAPLGEQEEEELGYREQGPEPLPTPLAEKASRQTMPRPWTVFTSISCFTAQGDTAQSLYSGICRQFKNRQLSWIKSNESGWKYADKQ